MSWARENEWAKMVQATSVKPRERFERPSLRPIRPLCIPPQGGGGTLVGFILFLRLGPRASPLTPSQFPAPPSSRSADARVHVHVLAHKNTSPVRPGPP